jgi:hypothetical protein
VTVSDENAVSRNAANFLRGDGELAARIAAHDWSASLGPIAARGLVKPSHNGAALSDLFHVVLHRAQRGRRAQLQIEKPRGADQHVGGE